MSARVENPFSLQEMRRLVRPAFRPEPDPVARARVCRKLYGCASDADSRAFALREIAMQRERAAERWNFDFEREVPRSGGRYTWTSVAGQVPAAYKMPNVVPLRTIMEAVLETARATVPTVRAREPQADSSASADRAAPPATPLASDATPADTVPPALASPETTTSTSTPSTRQTALTDFFRKKRPLSSRKMEEGKPAKRARTLSNNSTSLQDAI